MINIIDKQILLLSKWSAKSISNCDNNVTIDPWATSL